MSDPETLKSQGNAYFQSHKYSSAIDSYSKAINLITGKSSSSLFSSFFPNSPVKVDNPIYLLSQLFSNRSTCYYKLYKLDESFADAQEALSLTASWFKPTFRIAECLASKRDHVHALVKYKECIPTSKSDTLLVKDRIKRMECAISDLERGLEIINLTPGFEICRPPSILYPIQGQIFEFARQMKNIIHIVCCVKSRKCVLIDACWDVEGIAAFVKSIDYQIAGCIATHFHIDHVGGIPPQPFNKFGIRVGGLQNLVQKLQVPAYVHSLDIDPLIEANPDFPRQHLVKVQDGYTITIGNLNLEFLHTPGHSKGSMCVLVENDRLFTGDTLFVGSCGRTDFPDSSVSDMVQSLRRLSNLSLDTRIFPGHSYGGEWSSIKEQKSNGALSEAGILRVKSMM